MAPTSSPQISQALPVSPARPPLDDVDLQMVEIVRDCEPIHAWRALDLLTASMSEGDRTAQRVARRELWDRLKRLKHLGILHGVGRSEVSVTQGLRSVQRRRPYRTPRPVGILAETTAVSASASYRMAAPQKPGQEVENNLVSPSATVCPPEVAPGKTENVSPPPDLSAAARELSRLARNRAKQWTGWLDGQRCWRGRLVRTPFGDILPLMMSNRGRVMLSHPDFETLPIAELRNRTMWKAEQLQLAKNPAAVALGKAKLGTKERPSTLKQVTARANGLRPCRPGRRRGRPRTSPQQPAGLPPSPTPVRQS